MAFNSELYLHESDRAAMQALRAIPGFSQLLKAYMSVWNERQFRILNMSSNLRISETQMRKYYDLLPPICEKLGIAVPELYLQLDVEPNAYTYGDTHPFVVLTSGLFKTVDEEQIPTVLAHECGHIACHHTLYRTMGNMILNGTFFVPGLASLITVPLQIAFAYWMRCSEYSADRAAVLCDGTPDKTIAMCMRFAGYDRSIGEPADVEAFMAQAAEYRKMVKNSAWNQTLEFMLLSKIDHPLNAVRAYECREWARSENYAKLLRYTADGLLSAPDLPLPEGARRCAGRPLEEVEAMFRSAGFRNITLRETHKAGLLPRDGQVMRVYADGKREFEKGSWCPAGAEIIITFYTPEPEKKLEGKEKR